MKLGVFTRVFADLSFEEMLDRVAASGLDTVELGTGGYSEMDHCDVPGLLGDAGKRRAFLAAIAERGLSISALSCHCNPLHPVAEVAHEAKRTFEQSVLLAEQLGVDTVNMFSGCPGESEHSRYPVWVTCPWPLEHTQLLEWQWQQHAIPYWREQNHFLANHGVRVAIEPHPGFLVYNTETALRLREACGESIGVNYDPSHFFWQGIDPVTSIRELGESGAIFHFHAKDTAIDSWNTARNGVLDTKSYEDIGHRSWNFRTVGYGHGGETWRNILSALRLAGYNGTVSIEHEDNLMSLEEGFDKAVAFLKPLILL
ncbi:sugar phosphate isomerase/epimerase family protein [Alicyclobacillus sp. ALC3]|uniref:sugar phosphate isomerase/epimerase family protein n=1 Tax=Alicyclobacillus sp. ALC3 TaxID=2796143 RepID=UPI00237963B4|nr:sugar phosphate isomerase/epimerase [Alicyclobacillus sp. ALC3]WDL97901.1 sugar phosphate isomerase/epimerase [Alicyclobacillus sp. ALC3]